MNFPSLEDESEDEDNVIEETDDETLAFAKTELTQTYSREDYVRYTFGDIFPTGANRPLSETRSSYPLGFNLRERIRRKSIDPKDEACQFPEAEDMSQRETTGTFQNMKMKLAKMVRRK